MVSFLSDTRNKWFVAKVREIEATGISQAEIAKKIGVMPQYITPILSGKRNASEKLIFKLCQVFFINPNELYSQIGTPIGLMTDDEIAAQDADANVNSGEAVPSIVLNNPSYQNLLNKVQEQAAEIAALNVELKDAYKEISVLQKELRTAEKQ